MNIFDFDFRNIESANFKEDSVREILLVPLLTALGYKPYSDFSIERSPKLTHPYVLIGSKKNKVSIFPDYILKIKNTNICIIDAKAPNQKINVGKNVEQAYSYAIHPEVRASLYALCNGHELTVFHVNRIEPIATFKLCEIESCWLKLNNLLSPYKIQNITLNPKNLYPDYGTYLYKSGINKETTINDQNVPIDHITKVNDGIYTVLINRIENDTEYAVSFDFDQIRLTELLTTMLEDDAKKIFNNLHKQPFKSDIFPPHSVNIESYLGKPTETQYEVIVPLNVNKFTSSCS